METVETLLSFALGLAIGLGSLGVGWLLGSLLDGPFERWLDRDAERWVAQLRSTE